MEGVGDIGSLRMKWRVSRSSTCPEGACCRIEPQFIPVPPGPSYPFVRSCLREDESELSYHSEFLPFCRSARRALWYEDIDEKYTWRAIHILFPISNSHVLLFYCTRILLQLKTYIFTAYFFISLQISLSFSFSLFLSSIIFVTLIIFLLHYKSISVKSRIFTFSSKNANNDETMTYLMIVQSHIPSSRCSRQRSV